MLSKLIKHEWKETWKIPVLICIIILFMALVSTICFFYMEPPVGISDLNVGAFILFMAFTMTTSGLSLVTIVYFAVRFYKNLYSDEGYLMHTLPVKPSHLILAKTLISSLWFFLINMLVVWAVFAVMGVCIPVMVRIEDAVSLEWFLTNAVSLYGMSAPAFGIFFLVSTVVSSFSSTLVIYASISLGQLFSKHKVMASILCYIGYNMLVSTISSIAMVPSLTKLVLSDIHNTSAVNELGIPAFFGSFMRTTLIMSVIGSVIIAIVSYILTEYIMRKQLNLD